MITWNIGDFGFDMVLSGQVPGAIHDALHDHMPTRSSAARGPATIDLWAVHPGGRTVLDAVERAFALGPPRWPPRATCCAATATCRRRP